MKKVVLAAALFFLRLNVGEADPLKSITLDFADVSPAPALEVYQNDQKTLGVTLCNNSSAVSTNGYAPIFYFFAGTNIVNVSCAWTSTNCIMQVDLTSLNLATIGTNKYACGVSNSVGVTIAQAGQLKITANPNH